MKLKEGLVYGLADVPRSCYFAFSQSQMELGCSLLKYDHL